MNLSLPLADNPSARRFLKTATVAVEFAQSPGVLETLEGPVPYETGDALLTGIKGERWPVVRARFEDMYEPAPDQPGRWKKRGNRPVLALRVDHAFEVATHDGAATLSGKPGDWLVDYSPGDQAIVANDIFLHSYVEIIDP
jgi:hypothetical protein